MKRIIIAAILTGAFSTLLMSQTTAWGPGTRKIQYRPVRASF